MPSKALEPGELTREEYLERDVWTLQHRFDELLAEDATLAMNFLRWAIEEWSKTILNK